MYEVTKWDCITVLNMIFLQYLENHFMALIVSYLALQRLSTANDEIVEVLLSKHQVLAALRFIRGIGGHDSVSARKFLDAAKQADDDMLFYTIFRFFEQRNQRLRGNPNFTPGKRKA